MKKLWIILTVAVLAFSPALVSSAQAGEGRHVVLKKKPHHHKHHHKHNHKRHLHRKAN